MREGLHVKTVNVSPIESLLSTAPMFYFLKNTTLPRNGDLLWTMNNEQIYCLQTLFIGKTGYGKSTTLNKICGQRFFETNDIESCTKTLYSSEYRLSSYTKDYFSLCDLPGIGESEEADKEYLGWYSKMLEKSACVVYVLRADQRDFTLDEMVINTLLRRNEKKLIVGLNYADKIEPITRTIPFVPTNEQIRNLEQKAKDISKLLNISQERIIYYSAIDGYNFQLLLYAIAVIVRSAI
jgi:small GTP-binding protein